jgi:hypothetical protein
MRSLSCPPAVAWDSDRWLIYPEGDYA